VGRYSQFLHSLRDEELPLGIDVWVLTGPRAPRQVSDQIQAGVEGFPRRDWFASLEAYYRDFDGVATNNFADDPNDPGDDLIAGRGTSWGADLLIRRDAGLLRPALAISGLHATRDFPDPTQGIDPAPVVRYPPIFDRRVDVELVIQGRFSQGVEAGLRWNFGTGLPFTRALAGYSIYDNQVINGGRWSFDSPDDSSQIGVVLGPRNAERYPAYHRLDVSVRKAIPRRWGTITPYIDVVNAYNRKNVLFYFYEYDRNPPLRAGVSMFPFLPTLGVEVSF
jgi:hypothetical protein